MVKCPICGSRMKSVYYFINRKDERKWVKAGYYCSVCKRFYTEDEIESFIKNGDENTNGDAE